MSEMLLKIENLDLSYGGSPAASGLSLTLGEGEALAIVGESGCGKSTLLKAILGLREFGVAARGSIRFDGAELTEMSPGRRRRLLGGDIGMIFQDPAASFNPIRTYKKQLAETLRGQGMPFDEGEVLALFEKLGLPEGGRILESCPYELSGGMNQRVAIAAAMLPRPRLLLLDEPTSALDVTTQKTVVEQLVRLRRMSSTAMLLVTHNLGVASRVTERVCVMYAGRIVEQGDTAAVLRRPAHPYTRSLIAALPTLRGALPSGIDGQPPLYGGEAVGCGFYHRCPEKRPECRSARCELRAVEPGHLSACGEARE